MEVMFERLANSTLRSRIAEQLRDAIVDGTLRTGERIVERKLAAQFGASLAVVREAIIQLEAEGFITIWPNTSTHVTQLSLAETEKIFAVRKVLEVSRLKRRLDGRRRKSRSRTMNTYRVR